MKYFIRSLLFVLVFCLCTDAHAIELLPSNAEYQARFEKGVPIKGTAVRELKQRDDGSWEYRFDVDSLVADINESVSLEWDNGVVRPKKYSYKLSGFFIKNRETKVSIDAETKTINSEHKGKKNKLVWEDSVLDKLGYQLQLRQDLLLGKRYVNYRVVDKGKIKDFVFRVIGEEALQTQIGLADSIVVEKVRSKGAKRKTTLWFAKNWHYLLVKMTQTESDGEKYEINITKARVGDLRLDKP